MVPGFGSLANPWWNEINLVSVAVYQMKVLFKEFLRGAPIAVDLLIIVWRLHSLF
jgi:hypothetical protein